MASASSKATIFFHQTTFGKNIELDANALRATRNVSFDNGIIFTNKQIKINECVHMQIVDVEENGPWLGSLAIGFIQMNPDSIRKSELCKSAIPSICQKTVTSYVKRIFDKLTKNTVITFYYNQEGAFFMLDGKEQDIYKNIDVKTPMWGVIDLYGNVKGITLVGQPNRIVDSRTFFTKYNQQPDKLPIQYFTQLNPANLQAATFHDAHGTELELYCQNKVIFRKNVPKLLRPYVFVDLRMTPGDVLYLRILSIDYNYRLPGVIGFTNASLLEVTQKFNTLPAIDPTGLYDRNEFWILNEDAFDANLEELDEYRISFEKDGSFLFLHNNGRKSTAKTIAFADANEVFYPFFFLDGRIMAMSLFGITSSTLIKPPAPPRKDPSTSDNDAELCQLCFDAPMNCVIIPCGHMFFCSGCRKSFESNSGNNCPLCRTHFTDVIEIEKD